MLKNILYWCIMPDWLGLRDLRSSDGFTEENAASIISPQILVYLCYLVYRKLNMKAKFSFTGEKETKPYFLFLLT